MKPIPRLVLVAFVLAALAIDWAILRMGLPNGLRGLFSAVLALCGGVYAATGFEPGDPPRRPWILLSLSYVTMIIVVLLAFSSDLVASGIDHWALVLANLLYGASMIVFVHVVGGSGLAPGWTKTSALVMALCVIFSGGTAAFSVATDLMGPVPANGKEVGLVAAKMASVVCDAIVFIGAANLVRMMLPMRGGMVARSYLLLAFGAGTFLVMDFINNFVYLESLTQMTTLGEVVAVAWAFLALAGITQGRLARH